MRINVERRQIETGKFNGRNVYGRQRNINL